MKRREINNTSSEFFEKQYELSAHNYFVWQLQAENLKRAVDILIEINIKEIENKELKQPLFSTIHLLLGLTLENILKGIYVKRGNRIIEKGELKYIKTHKLLNLLATLKINTNTTEYELIERLEIFIEWAGRYPIPINVNEYKPKTFDNGGFGPLNYTLLSDYEVFEKLYKELSQEFK